MTLGQDGCRWISRYVDDKATPADARELIGTLRAAFPRMEPDFFSVLLSRVLANGFTKKRLADAVMRCVDTKTYQTITVADVVSHDIKVRAYTYNEVSAMVTRGEASFGDFTVIMDGDTPYRVLTANMGGGVA